MPSPRLTGLVSLICVISPILSASTGRDAEKHHVIIVGAGVSGFTAAATLLDHNVTDVLLLEASDRIGGRTHTVEFGGVPIDKGAEFIHGEVDNAVYELLKPYDFLVSYNPVTAYDKCFVSNTSGHLIDNDVFGQLYDKINHIVYEDGMKDFNGSTGEYFNSRYNDVVQGIDPELAERVRHAVWIEESLYNGAKDLYQLGARGEQDYRECEGDLYLKWKPGTGGYKTLFDIISKKFPNPAEELPVLNKTLFGKQVTRVELGDGQVSLQCADGSTYRADHVIVTVSLGVLKKHAAEMFRPPLSKEKLKAIETLGIGCVGKVFMLFPERWWPSNVTTFIPALTEKEVEDYKSKSAHGNWSAYTSSFAPVLQHERMLCAWMSGDACHTMEALSDDEVIDGLMELLGKLVGERYNFTRPEKILRTSWAHNPFVLGAYSYRTLESDKANISSSILEETILQEDKPILLFGGEATHPHYFSTVHGALETGRREARKIVEYVKNHPRQPV